MAALRCPQCGTEIKDPTADFCPNPECGYPLSFAKEPEPETPDSAMERRPLEKDVAPAPSPPVVTQPTPAPPPVPPTPAPTPPAERKRGPNPGLLIAIAVGIALLVALIVAFTRGGGDDDATGENPPEKRGAAVADTPTPEEPAPEPMTFARVHEAAFDLVAHQVMHRVVADDDELVAVGHDTTEGDLAGAVWTSPDGTTWQDEDEDLLEVGGLGDQDMIAIEKTSPGEYVIVGYAAAPDGTYDAAVWTYDGVAFTLVEDSSLGGGGNQEMVRVVYSPRDDRFYAVGRDASTDQVDPQNAAVWKSHDGTQWAAIQSPGLAGEHDEFMRSITPFDDGLVGVGDVDNGVDYDAAVWKSKGESFDRIETSATFVDEGDQAMFTVIHSTHGLVAVGAAHARDDVNAGVWLSDDGLVWKRTKDPDDLGGAGRQTMFGAVEATENLIVAVGWDDASGDPDPAIWTSSDGRDWTRAIVDGSGEAGEQRIQGVAVYDGTIVAVGWDETDGDYDAAVWTAPLPE